MTPVRRSLLFSPGHRERMLRKALDSGADSVCFDLEDAVAPEDKAAARETVRAALEDSRGAHAEGGPERVLRVNPVQGDLWRDDLDAAFPGIPDAVCVPKAEDADHVRAVDQHLGKLEREHGADPGATELLLLVETAWGVLRATEVATASPRATALLFGAEDLAADVGAERTREAVEVLHARSHAVLVAGAVGVAALDQVFVDLEDQEALLEEARFARRLGYGGKMAIHPAQLAPIHEAFTPTREEAEEAARVLAAAREAGVEQGGVVRFEGRMLERPIVEQARRVVAVARRAGLLEE